MAELEVVRERNSFQLISLKGLSGPCGCEIRPLRVRSRSGASTCAPPTSQNFRRNFQTSTGFVFSKKTTFHMCVCPTSCNVAAAGGPGGGRGRGSPVRLLAELSLPHVIHGAEAELIGTRRDQAIDRHCRGLGLDAGQQDGPGSVCNRDPQLLLSHLHLQLSGTNANSAAK